MFELRNDRVEAESARAAGWLGARGLRAGDRLALAAPNHPSFLALTLGALRTGIVPVLVNAHLGSAERERILQDARPGLVLAGGSWPDWSSTDPTELAEVPLARPMHYTSGTTGVAKGVWSGVLARDDALALAADEADLWDPRPGDTYLVCSPLHHSAPHRIAVSALLAGARVLVFDRFDAGAVARAFLEEKVSGAFLVPTHLRRLLEGPFRAPDARRVLHAGEPCPEPLKRRAMELFPVGSLFEFYGSTEGQFTLCSSEEWTARPGTVGRARAGRVLSVSQPGPDGVGTVFVTAPRFARWEYWNDPDKTSQAWDGDRFTVGDLGRLDEDGYLFLEGRREDLIISGGVNVYPAEVERVIQAHDGVAEAAVFGVPDERWGQLVCAAFVGDADGSTLEVWLRARLAPAQVPKRIVRVESLPRTQTGKVKRSELASEV